MKEHDRNDTLRRARLGFVAAGLWILTFAGPARAVDGVIEINQSRALAGGVTAGDGPGYPIFLNTPGSYRLTSDLFASLNNTGIQMAADNITLDLNGFTLYGGGGLIADGIGLGGCKNIEIRNGTIRDFTRSGIFSNINTHYVRVIGLRTINNVTSGIELQGTANTVDGCTALGNAIGIRVFDGSLVINSVARGNTSFGLAFAGPGGYRSNVLTGNNGGDANAQVSNGLQLGSNVCGTDLVCP